MNHRLSLTIVILAAICWFASCTTVSRRMPGELASMHEFLTQDNPGECRLYHYNFERQAPRLYRENQRDSLYDVIDYLKTECGPSFNLEVARMLLLAEEGRLEDSLIGSWTLSQMLWYRSEQENLLNWRQWSYLYGLEQPVDNTHDNFTRFKADLAGRISSQSEVTPAERTLGLFYSGQFDSAFSRIQTDGLRGTALRRSYDDYVARILRTYPARLNVAFLVGSWNPQGNNDFLGSHPEIGMQLGGEGRMWRADAIISYRFASAKNEFLVDSMGTIVSTDKFNSWLFGLEGGFKIVDNATFSTDIFLGIGYDVIFSVTEDTNPEDFVSHGSLGAGIGVRQRFYVNQRSGLYIGGIVRYNVVDYSNPHGTDMSGNTLSVSLVTGWSQNATLSQFLKKLNYRGSCRP